ADISPSRGEIGDRPWTRFFIATPGIPAVWPLPGTPTIKGGKTGGHSVAHLSKQCDLAAARPASPEVRREFVPWRDRTDGARKHRPLRSGTGPARCPCRARCFRRFALPQPRRTPKPAPWRSVLRPLHRATLAPCRGPVPPRTTTVMIGVPAGGTGAW